MTDTAAPRPPDGWPTAPSGSGLPRVGFPEMNRPASQDHRFSHATMIVFLAAGLAILALILVVTALVSQPPTPPVCPPLTCQSPPIRNPMIGGTSAVTGTPVEHGQLYTNSQGFTVRYYTPFGIMPQVSSAADGITLTYDFASQYGGTSQLAVIGAPAGNTTDVGLVQSIIGQIAPNAQLAYQLPGALVGYQLGVGGAYDVQEASSSGSTYTDRVIVMAAIVNGFGITVIAAGQLLAPVTDTSPFWNGHASPANLNIAYGADETVNSIRFPS